MPSHVQGREGFGDADNPDAVGASFFRGALFGRNLVLRVRIEIRGVVALVKLAGGVA